MAWGIGSRMADGKESVSLGRRSAAKKCSIVPAKKIGMQTVVHPREADRRLQIPAPTEDDLFGIRFLLRAQAESKSKRTRIE